MVVLDAEACSAAAALLDLQAAPPRMGEYLHFVFHCSSPRKHSPMCALPSGRRGNGEGEGKRARARAEEEGGVSMVVAARKAAASW